MYIKHVWSGTAEAVTGKALCNFRVVHCKHIVCNCIVLRLCVALHHVHSLPFVSVGCLAYATCSVNEISRIHRVYIGYAKPQNVVNLETKLFS